MRRRMLKSKIHRATVTGAHLAYPGSVSLDPELMELADILENEQVAVLDVDNGARLETYAIRGRAGEVCLNGAAARLIHPGDTVIVLTYADYEEAELDGHLPRLVAVDADNRPVTGRAGNAVGPGNGAGPAEKGPVAPVAVVEDVPRRFS